jgi:hypothetical protein
MKSRQAFFFATLIDIKPVLEEMERLCAVSYHKTGLFDNQDIPFYKTVFDAPNLGYTLNGDWNYTDTYLVMPKEEVLRIRNVPQRAGGTRYAVDQAINLDSVTLAMGGQYLNKENILVASKIATISNTRFSLDYFKKFNFQLRRYKKIGSFYVGKEAEEKLRNGWRLVTDDRRPKEYDLALK